ncbi:hypothetical protein, partial [Kibdelosporangium philippinense]|uniref:hypothetical protein n=1 Tax=Kibdelosporangium philippinense TaxID=211113 RepID=UPI0035EF7BA3
QDRQNHKQDQLNTARKAEVRRDVIGSSLKLRLLLLVFGGLELPDIGNERLHVQAHDWFLFLNGGNANASAHTDDLLSSRYVEALNLGKLATSKTRPSYRIRAA